MSLTVYPSPVSKVAVGGQPNVAIYGNIEGGIIVNPRTAEDQGIAEVENLYIDIVNPASLGETFTTIPIAPGQLYKIPGGLTTDVSVNAASSGHKFSAILWQPSTPPIPPGPFPPFPPADPTSLTETIPSYLYQEYKDDDDLQAFVKAFNTLAQEYVDWFNQIGLPIYTGPMIVGNLLDWVAEGLYGLKRPVLSSGRNHDLGLLNTYRFDTMRFNARKIIGPQNYSATSDDIFKRIITWHFYKGDGKIFNVRWLKRRVLRFLIGVDGADADVANTDQISVSFGVDNQVNIRLLIGLRTVVGGSFFNANRFNAKRFNELETSFQGYVPFVTGPIFKEAVDSGVLELPFQFNYVVSIN